MFLYQVKATAENVDEAVRGLPDANLVRYSFHFRLGMITSCLADVIYLHPNDVLPLLLTFMPFKFSISH